MVGALIEADQILFKLYALNTEFFSFLLGCMLPLNFKASKVIQMRDSPYEPDIMKSKIFMKIILA